MTTGSNSVASPSWPKEVSDRYEAVRCLGRGGFASVMLAKTKGTSTTDENHLVAIKLVKADTDKDTNYAHREIYILKEISHTNIMTIIESFEPTNPDQSGVAAIVLNYAKGKSLEFLLSRIGAPSLVFGRAVIAQLVDAVAYLHTHAVIHRDIKPDNLVVKGINLTDEAILEGTNVDDLNWKALKEKWHVTLVDFGFARALGPKDIGVDSGLKRELDESGRIASMKDSARRIESSGSIHDVLNESSSSARKRRTGSIGASRHVIRQLSALGHRDYAAPEVKNKVREVEAHQDEGVTCTLSGYVSDYAMVADAYSVGATIRHILTGVPPQESVDAVIANHNNPINKMARWVGKKVNKKSQNKPKKRYRPSTEIPGEAVYLIKEMTKADTASRMSVRDARLYPYIDDLFEEGIFKKEILKFLSFVQEKPAGNP